MLKAGTGTRLGYEQNCKQDSVILVSVIKLSAFKSNYDDAGESVESAGPIERLMKYCYCMYIFNGCFVFSLVFSELKSVETFPKFKY
jgi:hypothetical protein